jgi:Icc-related predicted phosphoesterase
MLVVADVHGAAASLRRIAGGGDTLLVLGDLINFIDYRTNEGIVADVAGRDFVADIVRLRTAGRGDEARLRWEAFADGNEAEVRARFDQSVEQAYAEVCAALTGTRAFVTHGNVDRPEALRRHLPAGVSYVDGEVVQVDGLRVGLVGGGMPALGIPGERGEGEMAGKLEAIGDVDVLCTHVPPALSALSNDVIGGRQKGSVAVRDYLSSRRPAYHYFGDIHQPQATRWKFGATMCINVGYFRATGRAVRHV